MKEDIICYCNNVSRATIQDAIENRHAKTVVDIKWATGACKCENCEDNNPSGVCCEAEVKKMLFDYHGEVCEAGPSCSCCS